MSLCPDHPKSTLNLVCLTQACSYRGAICQFCAINHKSHDIQQMDEWLKDYQKLNNTDDRDIQEEQNSQQKVLHQLDDLKKNIINTIAKLQINSQLTFQQEIQVRRVYVSDQKRQQELIKVLQSQQALTGVQVRDRILELLHRFQAKHPNSALHRYQEVSRRIEQQGKDILQTITSLMDVEERRLNKTLGDESMIKSSNKPMGVNSYSQIDVDEKRFNKNLTDQSSIKINQAKGANSSTQFWGQENSEEREHPTIGITPPKYSNTPSPLSVLTSQKGDFSKNYYSDLNQNYQSSRSKSPIFSTPKREDTIMNNFNNGSSSRRQLQQRDLEPVGTFTSLRQNQFSKQDSSKSSLNLQQDSQDIPQSRQSITMPSPKQNQKLFVVQEYKSIRVTPQSEIKVQQQSNNQPIQSKSAIDFQSQKPNKQIMESQIFDQGSQVKQQSKSPKIVVSKSQLDNLIPPKKSQDLNSSQLSNISAAPPPVKRASNLQSQFYQEKLLNWRAHEKGVKDICLMDADKIISCSGDSTIRIWDKNNSILKINLEGHSKAVLCIDFHRQKRILASGSADRSIKIWRPAPTWKCINTLNGHQDRVRSVCFINESMLASGSDDCSVRIWDLDQGGVCQFTIDVGGTQPIERNIIDFASSISQTSQTQAQGRVSKILSHQGLIIASSSKHICTWENTSFKQQHNILAHDNLIISMAIQGSSLEKSILITGGKDCVVKLWELNSMNMLIKLTEDYPAASLGIDPTATYLAVGSFGFEGEGKISIWQLKGQQGVPKVHETYSNPSGCNALLFDNSSTNERLLIFSAHENKKIEVHSMVIKK